MGGSSKTTKGYRYSFAVHMGLCRGPIDELVEIQVDEKTAWRGSVTDDSDDQAIEEYDLFGGDDKEGGIVGGFSLLMGKPGQNISVRAVRSVTAGAWFAAFLDGGYTSIPALIGGLLPSFRGVTTLFYRGQISANNPYPKPWRFRLRRTTAGWYNDEVWYPEKAAIWLAGGTIKAMNPAHMIYQCITDKAWGRGFPTAVLDDAAFTSTANTLCDEGFGLCMRWTREEPLSQFMQTVLDHIGGVLYVDRGSGLIALRLIRDDYDAAELPLFESESGLLSVEQQDAAAQDTAFNEVVVTFTSPTDGKERSVRAQNLAAFQASQSVLSTKTQYPGLPTGELALRVAQRDLRMHAVGLKRYKITLDRRGWKIGPAGVFRIRDVSRGIGDIVLRAGKVEDSTHTDGKITVTAIQDVFGLPVAAFTSYQPSEWVPPDTSAAIPEVRQLLSASYRDAVRNVGATAAAALAADTAHLVTLAAQPTTLSVSYAISTRVGAETFAVRDMGDWTTNATLLADLTAYATTLTALNITQPGSIAVGEAALIDGEVVRIDAFDPVTGVMTIARGCGDTIPAAHPAGARIWFTEDGAGTDQREYVSGETVDVKLLTRTSSAMLDAAAAPTDSIVLDGRPARPYPPGGVAVNGHPFASLPPSLFGDLVFTWTHRDRLLEQDQLVEHGAASIGPEPGTTYTIRLYSEAVLLRTAAGVTGTTWTYDAAMSAADGDVGVLDVEMESSRDGLVSWQKYSFRVIRSGFNRAFDYAFDGGI